MKIQVKIHDASGHIRTVDVPTGKKITTFITPEEGKFNYELIDLETGVGPQSIVAKRQGNDLAITFENADQPDLIFENYYASEEPSVIMGLAEDGNYYAYIPESGFGADAIPNLNEAVLASEVLGGERIGAVPFAAIDFAGWKALLGGAVALGAAALVAGAAGGSKSDKLEITQTNPQPAPQPQPQPQPEDPRVLPTPDVRLSDDKKFIEVSVPADQTETGDKLIINVTEKGNTTPTTVELTKQEDGSWTSNNEGLIPSVSAPEKDANGNTSNIVVVKIDASKVEPGTDVTAVVTDKDGNTGNPDQDNVQEENDADPLPPTVKAKSNGDVDVIVPPGLKAGDKVVVQLVERGNYQKDKDGNVVVDEDGKPVGIKTVVELVKQPDGSYLSSNPDLVPSIPAGGDTTTIDGSKIEPGSTVDASTISSNGKVSGEVSEPVQVPDDIAPNDPIVTPKAKGGIEVALPNQLDANDERLEISVLETGKTERTPVTLTKDENGNWVSSNPDLVPSIPAGEKATLIDGAKIDDVAPVTAQLFDEANNKSAEVSAVPDVTPPPAPTVTPKENGKVTIEVPQNETSEGDKLKITVQEPDKDEPTIVTLTKQEDGSWVSDNPTIAPDIPATPDKDGKFKTEIDGSYIKPGTEVKAIIEDSAGNTGDEDKAEPDTVIPDAPIITPNPDGSVTVTLPESAKDAKKGSQLEVTVERPDGSKEKATLVADGEGNWVSDKPNLVPSIDAGNNSTTIPADPVNPIKVVSAQIIGPTGNKGQVGEADAEIPDLTPPQKPEVTANPDGSVEVKLPTNAKEGDKVEVTITRPGEAPQKETLTKKDDGSWESSNPSVLPPVSENDNTSTIPAEQLPPGTEVKAETISKAGVKSDPDQDKAIEPEVSPAPEAETDPNDPGAVVIKPEEGNTKLTVTFKDENGNDQTLVVEKDPETGDWKTTTEPTVPVKVDPTTGTITIPGDSIEDKSEGTIVAQNGKQPASEPKPFTAGTDAPADSPVVSAGTEPGSVTVTPGKNNDKVEATYTDENGVEHKVVAEKDPTTGKWTGNVEPADNGVTIDPETGVITIPGGSVKDDSPVKATGFSGNNPASEANETSEGNAGSDTQSPAPAIAKDPEGGKQGGVVVTPSAGNTKVTVNFNDETGAPQTAVAEKNPTTGKWEPKGDLPEGVSVDPETGKITLEPDAVEDESEVTVTAQNGNNPESSVARVIAEKDAQAAAPTVEAITEGEEKGAVVVTPGEGNTAVTVSLTDENDQEQDVIAVLDPTTEKWELLTDVEGVSIDPESGVITIAPDAVKDGSTVSAAGSKGNDPESTVAKAEAAKDVASGKPTVVAKEDGSVEVTPAEGNTKLIVDFTDEEGTNQKAEVEVEKGEDGKWVATHDLPAGVTLDPETGKVTLAPNAVQDGSTVNATGQSGNNDPTKAEPVQAGEDVKSAQPEVARGEEPGSVVITPNPENDKVNVTFTDEKGVEQPVEIVKNSAGQWTPNGDLPKGVQLDRNTGVITLTPDSVQDDQPVTATGTSGNNKPSEPNTLEEAGKDAPSKAPTIENGPTSGSVEVTPEKDNTEVTVKYTDEATGLPKEVTVAKDPETGKWAPVGDLPKDVTVDPDTGKVTLGPDAVLDNTPVTAVGKSGNNEPTETGAEDFKAGTDPVSPAPTVTEGAQPGSADIIPANGNTKVTVDFTGEDDQPKQAVAEKNPETGKWELKEPTPAEGVTIDPETGRITLDPNAVKDGTPVTATGQNGNDPVSQPEPNAQPFVAKADEQSEKPTVGAGTQPGSMEVTPHPENTKLTVSIPNEQGTTDTFTIEKKDGQWEVTEGTKPAEVEVNPVTGKVSIPADSVEDGQPVKATAQTGDNPVSEEVSEVAGQDTASPAPTISAGAEEGSVTITPAQDGSNDIVKVTFKDESEPAKDVTVTAEKKDGKWALTDNPAGDKVTIDPTTGVITLTPDAVRDSSEVSAVAKSGNNPESAPAKGTAATDKQSEAPVVVQGTEPGSLVVTPGKGNDKVTLGYTDEAGEPQTLVATKEDGVWKLPTGTPETVATIDPVNGTITLKPDAVKDNSPVEVTGQKGNDPVSTTTTTTTTTDAPSEKPSEITAGAEEGSVEITPAPENTEVTVTFTDEEGEERTVTFTKDPDTGKWEAPANAPEGVTVSPDGTKLVLEPNAVKDNTPVKATAKSGENPSSVEVTTIAGEDAQSPAPTVEKDTANQGGVLVKPAEGNTSVVVQYTDEKNAPQTVTAKLTDGKWAIEGNKPVGVSVDEATGVITLAPNSVRDETEVNATAQNGNNPVSENAQVISDKDPRSAQPTVKADPASEGAMIVEPAPSNTAMDINFTDEDGKPVAFTVTKDENTGEWTVTAGTKPDAVVVDPQTGKVSIPANSIQDDVKLFATGQDGNNEKSVPAEQAAAQDGISATPTVAEGKEPGSLVVTPDPENTRLVIDYTDENGAPRTVDVEKDPATGQWKPKLALPAGVELDPATGKVTLPADVLKDGTPVTVKGQDGNDPLSPAATKADGSPLVAETDKQSEQPTITKGEQGTDKQGSATVTPGEGNTKVKVDYIDENGTPQKVEINKEPTTGKWSPAAVLPQGVELDPETGVLTISNESILDPFGGEPSVIGAIGQKGTDPESARVTENVDQDPPSAAPTLKHGEEEQGSVVVTPAEGNTELKIFYHDENGLENTDDPIVLQLNPTSKRWELSNAEDQLPKTRDGKTIDFNPITGEVTIPADLLKDNDATKPVRAIGKSGSNPESEPATITPKADAQSDKPTLTAGQEPGSVVATPHPDNYEMEITFPKTADGQPATVKVFRNGPTADWALGTVPAGVASENVVLDPKTGKVTIKGAAIQDNQPVTAVGRNGEGDQFSEPATIVSGNDNASPAPTITPTVEGADAGKVTITPETTNNKLTVNFTDENNQPQTLTIEKDPNANNKWVAKTNVPAEVTFDENTGVVTLKPNAVKDESEVTAKGTSPNKDESAEVKEIAPVDERSPAPVIKDGEKEGSVVVTPTEPATKLTVDFTDEQNQKQQIVLEKQPDGSWEPKQALPEGVALNKNTGELSFSPDSVRDRSQVKAVAQNGDNPESLPATHTAASDGKSDQPVIESILNPDWLVPLRADGQPNSLFKQDFVPTEEQKEMQGGATITPHENNTEVVLQFIDENGIPRTVNVKKDAQTNEWSVLNSPRHNTDAVDAEGNPIADDSVKVDPRTGKITLMPNAVADKTVVEVLGRNGTDPLSDAVRWTSDPDRQSDAPEIITDFTSIGQGAEQGSVAVKPHSRNTKEVISYIDEDGTPQTITTVKEATGKWVFQGPHPADVTLDQETGLVIIPPNRVKDKDQVFARGTNGNNPESELVEGTSELDAQSHEPTITAGSEQGSAVITPHADNVRMTIRYQDENGIPVTVVANKAKDNTWAFVGTKPAEASIDPATGVVTIGAEGIRDPQIDGSNTGSVVRATGEDGYAGQTSNFNPVSPEARFTPSVDAQSPAPEIVDGFAQGSVIVGPGAGNTKVEITFTNENGVTETRTVQKNRTTGAWAFEGTSPDGVTIDTQSGRVTFSPNSIQDGSTISAKGQNFNPNPAINSANPVSETVTHVAQVDPKSPAPTILDNAAVEQGSVTVTPHSANERMTVTFTDERDRAQTVELRKNGTLWSITGTTPAGVELTNPRTGMITIKADSLKAGTDVTAVGQNPNRDPASDVVKLAAPEDAKTLAPIMGSGAAAGSVTVQPQNPAKNTQMTVKYTDENEQEHTIVLNKVRQGNGTVWQPTEALPEGVVVDASTGSVTIAPDSLLDGSKVTAQAVSGDDPISDWAEVTAGTDARSPAPTVSAKAEGAVDVIAHPQDTFVKASYTDEKGQPKEVAILKDPQTGTWSFVDPESKQLVSAPEGVTLDETNGIIKLDPNEVQDGSKVKAQGQKGNDPISEEVEATAGADKQSEPPVVTPTLVGPERGAVVVTPNEENTELTVDYTDEAEQPKKVKAVKEGDVWKITEGNDPLVEINPETGAITLKPNALKDGSDVVAQSRTENDPVSEQRKGVAALDAPSPMPTVSAGEKAGSVVITPNEGDRPNTENTIRYTDENGAQQEVATKKGDDGVWRIVKGAKDGVSIDPATGAVTLDPNSVADNSTVQATGISGNDPVSPTATGTAGVDAPSPAPTITPVTEGANKGAMEITPNADNASMTVNYRDEANEPKVITAAKNPQGQWTLTNNPDPEGVSIDPRTGKVTIAPESVLDRSQVTAKGKNANDPESAEVRGTAPEDAQSPAPAVTQGTDEQGSVVVTPAAGNTENEIKFTNENGANLTINTVKEGNEWKFVGEAFGAKIDPETGKVTLPADLVEDNSTVTATGRNGTNPVSEIAEGQAAEDAQSPKPTVAAGSEQGSVVITPHPTNTRETITYTDEQDRPQTITIVKNSAGVWAPVGELPALVTLNRATGVITIAPNGVKDGEDVIATGQNGNNKVSEPADIKAGEDATSPKPTVAAGTTAGSVTVAPAAGNTKNSITYTDEEGNTHKVETTFNGTTWELTSVSPQDEGVSINPNNGMVTIAPNSVRDGSTVTATGQNDNNPVSEEAQGQAGTDAQSPAPVISATAGKPGSVTVTPHATNTKETFSYRDENGVTNTVNLEKDGATWKVANNGTLPAGLTLDPDTGAVEIGAQAIEDNSRITATGQNGNDPVSTQAVGTAGLDPKSPSPTVAAGRAAGSVTITPAAGNTKETITFTDENGTQHTVQTEKEGNTWAIKSLTPAIEGVTINPTTGVVTLAPETVRDGSQVTAIGQNGTDPVSDPARGTAGNDAASPTPTFAAGEEQGSVVVTPADGNTRMNLTFTTEQDATRNVAVVKDGNTWRFDPAGNQAGLTLNPTTGEVTIAADSVKDTSVVSAIGQNGNNPVSAQGTFTAPVDAKAPTPVMGLGAEQGSITVTPDNAKTDAMTVRFTDEGDANRTIRINKGTDGRWTFNGANHGAQLDPATGKVTIPADAIKDRSTATAFAQKGNNPVSDNATIQAPVDAQSPAPNIAANPAEQGSVIVTPAEGNTRNTINYINEVDTGRTQTINTVKNGNVWSFVGNSNGFTIDPTTGAVTIPANSLLDNSKVTATGQNGNNPVSVLAEGTAPLDKQSPAPSLAGRVSGQGQGQVTITPAAGNTKNTINYTDENDVARVINTVKDGANWSFVGDSFGATINRTTGAVIIPAEGVKDGSRVSATGQNGNDPISTTTVINAPNDPQSPAPTVTPIATGANQGAVEITPAAGNTRMTLNFTTEADTARALATVKEGNTWRFDPAGAKAGATIDPTTGKVTLAPDSVKDGSTVNAIGQNGNNPISNNASGVAPTDARSPAPTIQDGVDQGSVDIRPGAGNTANTITFVDENGNNRTINTVKNGNTWSISGNAFGATIDAANGLVTIPAQGVRDLSAVTATGQNGNNPISTTTRGTAPLDPKSPPPVIAQGTEEGSLTVTPVNGNTTMKVQYTNEQDRTQEVNIAKNAQGRWAFVGTPPAGVTVDAATGKVTLPANAVKDQSKVQAQAQNTNDPISDWAEGIAGNNPVQAEKLRVSLRTDSGSSNTDNYTNDPRIWVDGVPDGQAWEYSINGGATWQNGGVGGNGREFFDLPSNTRIEGVGHAIKARLSGSERLKQLTESNQLNMTLDQTVRPNFLIDPNIEPTRTGMSIIGKKEDGSTIGFRIGQTNPRVNNLNYRTPKPTDYPEYDVNYATRINGTIDNVFVVETDKAGNQGQTGLPTVYSLYHLKGGLDSRWGSPESGKLGTSGNDVVLLTKSGKDGDGVLKNANMDTGARVNLGDGDDYFLMEGSMLAHTYVDMGNGNDTFDVFELASPGSPLEIKMGDGNDHLIIRDDYGARNYAVFGSRTLVDLGSGDDKITIRGDSYKFASPEARLLGGDGYDTLISEANLKYQDNSQIEFRELNAIKGFEKLIMRGGDQNFLINRDFLRDNHDTSNTFTVEGGGRLHLKESHSIRPGTVTNDGHTYKVVDFQGYTVLVENSISIIG